MTRRVAHYLALFVSATLFGLALTVGATAWLLAQGPIRLTFLTPYLEQALNESGDDATFGIGDTVLIWAGWDRRLDVRAVNVSVTGADGRVMANIPQLSLSLSGRALMQGAIRPTRLDFFGASLNVVRREDGGFGFSTVPRTEQPLPPTVSGDLIEALLADMVATGPTGPLAYLRHLSIRRARIILDDRLTGTEWGAERADIQISRRGDQVLGFATFDVVAGDLSGRFEGEYALDLVERTITAEVSFRDVPPALLSLAEPALEDVERLEMKLSGRVGTSLTLAGEELGGELVLRGGPGTVALPEIYPRPLEILALDLKLSAAPGFTAFDLERLHLDFGGPKVDLSAQLGIDGDDVSVAADLTARSIPAADWPELWPEGVGVGARSWMVGNMLGGTIDIIQAKASGATLLSDPGAFELADLSGTMALSGFELHYLRPMPPIKDIGATATFDADTFEILTEGGTLGESTLERGAIDLIGLGSEREIGSIDVVVSGPVEDVMRLIDSEPLNFLSKLEVDPAGMSGSQRSSVVLQVPLVDAASIDDLVIAAASSITGFRWRAPPFGPDIEDADLTLRVNPDTMRTEARARIAGSTVDVVWEEFFDGSSAYDTRLQASGQVGAAAREAFGLSLDPYITGPVGVGVVFVVYPDGHYGSAVQADLTPATMAVEDIGWQKPPGEAGEAYVELGFDGDALTALAVLRVRTDDLRANAAIDFRRSDNGETGVQRVSIERLALDKTSVFGTVEVAEDGATRVVLGGESLDLGRLLDGDDEAAADAADDGEEPADAAADDSPSPPISIEVLAGSPLQRVLLSDTAEITNVSGELHFRNGLWRQVDIQAEIGDGGSITINLDEEESQRTIYIASDDAGEVMAGLDVSDRIYDGSLEITGTIESDTDYLPIEGHVLMEDFSVRDAPTMARVLSLASFTAIANSLNGEGLAFDRLESPFRLVENRLEVLDAIATGPGLGITTHGSVTFDPKTLDLAGEVAPAYGVNRLLGAIPLLGMALAGDSGAVFAATYRVSGPIEDVSVSVNPLAALAPGSTRKLMRNREKVEEKRAAEEEAATEEN